MTRDRDDKLIEDFVSHFNLTQGTDYEVTRWPDKEKARRQTKDIDAYAEASSLKPLAIELTNTLSFHNEKAYDAWFTKVCGALEKELNKAFSGSVTMTIHPFAIQPGQDWTLIKELLHSWLMANVEGLPVGRSDHSIAGVPFRISIFKHSSTVNSFFVARWSPSNRLITSQIIRSIRTGLRHKYEELGKYKGGGAITILLLESDEVALLNNSTIYMAFLRAKRTRSIPNIDQVWLAETNDPNDYRRFWCFDGPEAVMSATNPPNFMFSNQHSEYWAEAIKKEKRSLAIQKLKEST